MTLSGLSARAIGVMRAQATNECIRIQARDPGDFQSSGARDFVDVAISEFIGRGRRCVAFAARRSGLNLVAKVYHPRAIARHEYRCGGSLARYEYERNALFNRMPDFAGCTASPIGFLSSQRVEMFLQERVYGEKLKPFLRTCPDEIRGELLARLRSLLDRANQAGLYNLDLHPSNIIVRESPDGRFDPVLFDFNKLPNHVRPPSILQEWLSNLGLTSRRSRDHRHLMRFRRSGRKAFGRLLRYC